MRGFLADTGSDLFDLYDIIGRTYSILPSEVAKLDWFDLFVTVRALQSRGERMKAIIRKNRYKKGMIFPVLSLSDLADLI